jgi:hypothetical protein
MPTETKSRVRTPFTRSLDLPPPFRLVTLREVGDAFAHACAIAAQEGAGTLVHIGRFDLAEFAVVLEPEEPLRSARRALYTGLCALGDALSTHAPPEKPISFDWPDAVRVDGGLVGGVRLAWPAAADEDEPPEWLVFGAMIRLVAMGEGEPGLRPLAATLEQEGFDDLDSGHLVESFARHLMANIDIGRRRIGRGGQALSDTAALSGWRLTSTNRVICWCAAGGKVERRSITGALAAPSWLDPETGGPRT